ncbi:TIGR01777 family oxidoreductase [Undibacterium sp. Jales W-56]|uniref:TIGR01777 family oxidoreductase n=1 Tax=Undibacterium sp. Jales W-56 TaxID=2897325 RepID=UPI0021CF1480|nr:TIGR01777 family oxidoreductase [Undibacterium sp. Jales W-56]MCU6432717.1 TIGR01777 family oxidoreductase [Undibacterium sp. Jales W-56]
MRILITGGTGLIGRHLCAALLAKGHEISVLSRRPAMVRGMCGARVQPLASLQEWTPDKSFDAVINLAGEPIVDARWTARRQQILLDSRVGLTRDLVACMAAATSKPEVFLSGSAIGWYGDTGDQWIDEAATAGHDFAARLCLQWEQQALKANALGIRTVLLRTGLVLDAAGGMLHKLLLPFKLGLGARLGDGQQWMSWIHIDDYVAALLFLLEQTQVQGALNMTAPVAVRNAEFTQTLARVVRRPAWLVAPAALLKIAMGDMAILLLGGQRVTPQALQSYGFVFSYPTLEPALRALLKKQ